MSSPTKKFIIVEDYYNYELKERYIPECVWVTDFAWYNENATEFETWIKAHGCVMPGSIVKFPDKTTMTLFLLRWQ